MNYKWFLRQQLCILVRGADGGASMSCLLIMVVKRLCFRGFPQLVVITHSGGPFSQVYGY